jgi:hypothetical protein
MASAVRGFGQERLIPSDGWAEATAKEAEEEKVGYSHGNEEKVQAKTDKVKEGRTQRRP